MSFLRRLFDRKGAGDGPRNSGLSVREAAEFEEARSLGDVLVQTLLIEHSLNHVTCEIGASTSTLAGQYQGKKPYITLNLASLEEVAKFIGSDENFKCFLDRVTELRDALNKDSQFTVRLEIQGLYLSNASEIYRALNPSEVVVKGESLISSAGLGEIAREAQAKRASGPSPEENSLVLPPENNA
jgi:hypothetical protein